MNGLLLPVALGALSLVISSFEAIAQQPASAAATAQPGRVDIPMRRNTHDLFVVDVSLGRQFLFSGDPDADPLPFIFDTGANKTAVPRLIASQLVSEDELDLTQIGHGMTETFLTDLFFVDNLNFGLGERTVDIAVISENFGSVLSAAGILGSNAFEGETLQVDFPSAQLSLMPDQIVRADLELDSETGLVLGIGRIRNIDQPIRIMIDTGAQVSLVNSALAALRRGQSRAANLEVTGVTEHASVQIEQRRLFSGLTVGEFCLDRFWISVADVYAFEAHGWTEQPAMILGMDVLRDARLTIDYAAGAVSLEGVTDFQCRSGALAPS